MPSPLEKPAFKAQGFKKQSSFKAPASKLLLAHVDFDVDATHPLYDPYRRKQLESDELRDSLRERGLLQNIVCRYRPGGYDALEVVAGNRRVYNARRVDPEFELQITALELDDKETILLKNTENGQRVDDTVIAKAERSQRMMAEPFKCTLAEVAESSGVTPGAVRQWISLLKTDETVQAAVASGKITPKAAISISHKPAAEQRALVDRIVALAGGKPATAREAKAAARSASRDNETYSPPGVRELRRMIAYAESDAGGTIVAPETMQFMRWMAGELPDSKIAGMTELRRRATPADK